MSEVTPVINWIKTSDRSPNPTDNPNIIVAVRCDGKEYGRPDYYSDYEYVLCIGGKQVDNLWNDDNERGEFGNSCWFRHDEDIINAERFDYWSDFDTSKISWVDRTSDPLAFGCPIKDDKWALESELFRSGGEGAAYLVLQASECARVEDIFHVSMNGRDLALDTVYVGRATDSEQEQGIEGYLSRGYNGENVQLNALYYSVIPPVAS